MGQQYPLRISITGKEHSIGIGKGVIQALGSPKCICILKSKDKDSIAIVPCDEREYLSVYVPYSLLSNRHKKLRVYSRAFTDEIIFANDFHYDKANIVKGSYSEEMNAVIFPLKVF